MTAEQHARLWAFVRGESDEISFERWFLAQDDLEVPLGGGLHWNLASADYRDRDVVWELRNSLAQRLEAHEKCKCASIPDLAAIPMGGDGLDERVFATIENVRDHGGDLWWLHLSKCSACGQHWMIAQEERIFDEYFLRRVSKETAKGILEHAWPDEFITYERVLKIGHTFATPCVFVDPMSGSLIWSAHDLQKARPEITVDEIARLLGVTPMNAKHLLQAKGG
ncbi:hypothetical protein GCM10008023_17570 [Sphingomonas glacialis]|uniref:Uncharacterized protein n=1 Tax=Sphingomonas glacialis TaxID=658225 RepID=A0ABQ3LGA2_9SPHN|nr:hypothetical protein [Sphingomonas glacialis]GHH15128.1 hypothetical protein GCM10008023_17570 [Sphingomonas glacialis]